MSREKMPTDIDQLIHDVLHGQASDADRQRLSAWIVASEDHARAYLRVAMDERAVRANLEREASRSLDELDDSAEATGAGMILAELAKAEALVDAPLVELIDLRTAWWQEHAGPLFAAAGVAFAALIALAVILLVQDPEPTDLVNQAAPAGQAAPIDRPTRDAESPVATITATHNAKWSPTTAERASARGSNVNVGAALRPGQRLTLTAGFAEITTSRGAIAILQAPATIELLNNDNAIELHSGKLVGICETDSSRGFVVKTDHATITDIGTEFGVHAHAHGTDTTVFVGEVEVDTPGRLPQRITTNQTARVSTAKAQPSIVIEDTPTAGFARRLPRAPLVTNASINLDGFAVQVVPNGVYEDAKLFSDRDHELNGIDADGLPAFLIGGDVVRMPADARRDKTPTVGDTLQLTLELSAPCDIYVLIPEKGKPGDWLERDYENTGLFAGSDLTGILDEQLGELKYALAVGPGISIDEPLAVWKRKQPVSGRAMVTGTIANSMYAVIAVPYQTDNHHDSP